MSFVYLDSEHLENTTLKGNPDKRQSQYLVGFYDPEGSFYVVSSFMSPSTAEQKVHFLNGGNSSNR